MRLGVGVAALLVCTSAAAETYDNLATERVWDVTMTYAGSSTVAGKTRRSSGRHELVLATAPRLTPPGRLAVFVARSESETLHPDGDRSQATFQPPKSVSARNGQRVAKKIPLHIEKPPLYLGSELRVAPSGRVEGVYLNSKHSFERLQALAVLWPELPAKVAPGQKLTTRRELGAWCTWDPVALDVEVTVLAIDGGVAELALRAEQEIPRSAWRQDIAQYAHEFKTARLKVAGRAHVRLAPVEWLDAEADFSEELLGDLAPQGSVEHVSVKLTPRDGLVLAPLLGPILDD